MAIQRQQIRTHNMKTFLDRVVELAQQGYTLDPNSFPRRTFGNQFLATMVKADNVLEPETENAKTGEVEPYTEDKEEADQPELKEESTPKVAVKKQNPKTSTVKTDGEK